MVGSARPLNGCKVEDRGNTVATGHRTENYGKGQYVLSTDDNPYTPQAVVEKLRTTLESPDYEPPILPAIAMELIALTRNPNVSLTEVRDLMERDPVLTAKVLKVAQSALYGNGRAFSSISDALCLLGLRTVEEIFLQTALSSKIFRAKGFEAPMETVRLHSTATGHIARFVCRYTSLPDEYAFLCGLLHDVGVAAGLLILAPSGTPAKSRRVVRPRPPPDFAELAPALLAVHEEASEVLARAWKLPPDVQLVLRNHHNFRVGTRVHPLAAAVCVADWLASEAGAPLGGEARDGLAGQAARELGLTRTAIVQLGQQSRELLDKI